jgi:hypothetical protein
MSQIRANTLLFKLGQDHVAIDKLLVLITGLEIFNQSGSITRCKQNTNDTTVSQNQTNKVSHSLTGISLNTFRT